jgi:hypothetical protein
MKQLDPKDLRNAAIRQSMKLYSPYEVVAEELVDLGGDGYAVVYRAPLGGDRYIAATRTRRENATKLRDLLNRAWAEGKASSGRE